MTTNKFWLIVRKNWMFNPIRQVFRRQKDGLEISKEWAYQVINLDANSLEKELDKLAERAGYEL